MMKQLINTTMAAGLLLAAPVTASAWVLFLDGSTEPNLANAAWQFYQDGGTDGGSTVVDLVTNQLLRIESGANSTEWYTGPLFANEVVGAARFKTVAFSGTDSENLLCVTAGAPTDHSAAPSITIVSNRYKLWSYTEGTFGSGIGGSEIVDLGPVVLEEFHTAYLYAHSSGLARVWWDGELVFDGIAPAVGGTEGYLEWGSGSWQYKAATTVDFDWVGYGDVNDLPQTLFIEKDAGKAVLSWYTNASSYVLQTTVSLSPALWTNVTDPVGVVGTRYTVTNDLPGVARFYRLAKSETVVSFNDLATGALAGSYGGLDWGAGVWNVSGPYAGITSQNAWQGATADPVTNRINGGAGGAFLLKSLRASVGDLASGTLSLMDNNGQTASLPLTLNTPATLTTSWTMPSSYVDVTSDVGYSIVIDELTYSR